MTALAELRRRWPLTLLGLVVLLAVLGPRLAIFYTDILWFDSVGYRDRFFALLYTRAGLAAAGAIAMALLVGVNLALARRLAPSFRVTSEAEEVIERYRVAIEPYSRFLVIAAASVMGLLAAGSLVGEWQTFLLWANGGSFGIEDPHFGRDLGFFVFDLPLYTLVNGWLFGAVALTLVISAGAHYLFGGIRPQAPTLKITAGANVHLSVLLASLIGIRAWGFWLDRYMLSFSDRGLVTGLSYTDVNATLRGLTLLTAIAVVCVVLFLANIRQRGWVLPSAGVGILLVASLVLGGVYPAAIQAIQVNPQELPRERPFIERNLDLTRYAYGIETVGQALQGEGQVSYERFPAGMSLTADEVNANAPTLEAVRLWDPATLQNTYNQLQQLRPYYEFQDVDVGRYEIGDDIQQVMIAVREISVDNLQEPSWQNRTLVFTHGYGVVVSTVSTAASNGQPEFLSRDIPNAGVPELDLEEPRIYFGENSPPYSIINAAEDEFDFETEVEQQRNRYTGVDGVNIGRFVNRVAFALRHAEPNILLSNLIEPESRILFNRDVRQRVAEVAPFLQLDHDTYPIVVDGRVKWVQDAYTTTDMIPYSQRVDLGALSQTTERRTVMVQQADGQIVPQERVVNIRALDGQANYIRNSVKAVVDAYDGTVELYITEPEDPLIQAWDRAFPGTLRGEEEIPDEIRAHFRHPEDMFRVQARMLERYHIPDADGFYNASDEWELPTDSAFVENNAGQNNIRRSFPPTYQLIRLPGDETEDFSLIQPFVPVDRQVLSAYMAARGNPDERGQIRILQMPPTQTVFGPEQVFARISQDAEVSQLVTLLSQGGSQVIYGNLIVVPIEDSLLYALPLFLKADLVDIPELRRVVLVYGDEVVMEETLSDALEELFGDLPDVLTDVTALPEDPEIAAIDPIEIPDDLDADDADDADADAVEDDDEADGQIVSPAPAITGEVPSDVQDLIAEAIEAFAAADLALSEGDLGEYQAQVRRAEELIQLIEAALAG